MEKHADPSRSLVFVARDMTPEQKRKQPRLQVSVHSNAASTFGFRNNMQAIVLPVRSKYCPSTLIMTYMSLGV
jgi:hypothetical protein